MQAHSWIPLIAIPLCACTEETLDLSGTTWQMQVLDADYASADLQGLISIVLQQDVMIGIESMDDTQVQLRLALSIPDSDPPVQDTCGLLQVLPTAERDALSFALGPEDYDFKAYDNTYPMQDLVIEGTLSEDGSDMILDRMAMEVDLRTSAENLGYESAEALCALTETLELPCTPCEDNSESCLISEVLNIPMSPLEGELVDVREAWTDSDCVPPEE